MVAEIQRSEIITDIAYNRENATYSQHARAFVDIHMELHTGRHSGLLYRTRKACIITSIAYK